MLPGVQPLCQGKGGVVEVITSHSRTPYKTSKKNKKIKKISVPYKIRCTKIHNILSTKSLVKYDLPYI